MKKRLIVLIPLVLMFFACAPSSETQTMEEKLQGTWTVDGRETVKRWEGGGFDEEKHGADIKDKDGDFSVKIDPANKTIEGFYRPGSEIYRKDWKCTYLVLSTDGNRIKMFLAPSPFTLEIEMIGDDLALMESGSAPGPAWVMRKVK